jgi:hypothetical protein
MTDLRKAAEMALEALEFPFGSITKGSELGLIAEKHRNAVTVLRAALAQSSIKDTRDEEILLLREEIRRLRFCIPEGDAAAAMEYLAYCVEKDVAKEQERCIEIVERQLEAALGYVAVPLGNKITAAIRARGT